MVTRYSESSRGRSLLARGEGMKVAYLSTYPPRECGIATFCEDLIAAANHHAPLTEPLVVAMESGSHYHQYRRPVVHVVDDRQERDYQAAADFINDSPAEVVSIQHEFGIFGGPEGAGMYKFLARIRKPRSDHAAHRASNPSPAVRDDGERAGRAVGAADGDESFGQRDPPAALPSLDAEALLHPPRGPRAPAWRPASG